MSSNGNGKLAFHEVADVFPLMDRDEYQALKADIAQHGLRHEIWLHPDGRSIIDGRNRYIACSELGIPPLTRRWDGRGSLVEFVASQNLHRRHLNSSQRAAVGVAIKRHLAGEAKQRQRESGGDRKSPLARQESVPERIPEPIGRPAARPEQPAAGEARERAAKLAGTNARYIDDAEVVAEADPKLFKQIRDGEITVPQAKRKIQRAEKSRELKDRAARAHATAPADFAGRWSIVCGDCVREMAKLRAAGRRFRLIFADPPYNQGVDYGRGPKADKLPEAAFMDWCQAWMNAAAELLTDDGSLWVLISDEYAAEFATALKHAEPSLHRRDWIIWFETFGVYASARRKFSRSHRHLFHMVRDPKRFVFNAEAVMRTSDRIMKYDDARAEDDGKVWDDVWGIEIKDPRDGRVDVPAIPRLVDNSRERLPDFPTQLPLALLRPIIGVASDVGDEVLDPFNGSGTTGAACLELGRRYTGIEASETYAEMSKLRLSATSAERKAS